MFPNKSNLPHAQVKIAIIIMFKELKEVVNKCLREDRKKTNIWMKTSQDVKIEFNKDVESVKQSQNEIKSEKNLEKSSKKHRRKPHQ